MERWFNPKKHTGWKKSQTARSRRQHLIRYTDKRKNMHNRYVQAGRRVQALANVTTDPETEKLARRDAVYFFKKARDTK